MRNRSVCVRINGEVLVLYCTTVGLWIGLEKRNMLGLVDLISAV